MNTIDDDVLRFVSEEQSHEKKNAPKGTWKLIVADDDEEVHAVTALALSDFTFKGKLLTILSSYSAKETEKLIDENPDTAVILLDVVMEKHDSGLQLVKFIRETIQNHLVRIILRTGQPGYAPELEVITTFDINDYKEKTELTSSKLVTTLISSLRNYDDLKRIEESRKSMEMVASASAIMHELDSSRPFDAYSTNALIEVFNSFSDGAEAPISIFDGIIAGNSLLVENSTGDFQNMKGKRPLREMIPSAVLDRFADDNKKNTVDFFENSCTIFLQSHRGVQRIIHLKNITDLSEMKKTIIRTFCLNISTMYNNRELLEEQIQTENEIRKSLREKMVLVKEIHHRVKNNLQIISSLLHMQSSGMKDPKLISIIRESENRVQSMALVHEKLYQSDLMATIDFSEYIRSLAERLIHSYSVYENISLRLTLEPLMLSINTAIPCGLIVNEVLTNSIKYAFPDNQRGIIYIDLKNRNDIITLEISDNGIGLPIDLDLKKIQSLGLKLIQILTEQIDGEMKIISEKGTTFSLSFSESEERES